MHSPSYLPEHIRIRIKETIVYSLDLLKRFHSTLDHQFRFNSTSTIPPFLVRARTIDHPPHPVRIDVSIIRPVISYKLYPSHHRTTLIES